MASCFSKQPRFYPIGESLEFNEDAWLQEIKAGDLVVFIDYFGFRFWDEWGEIAAKKGAIVVEDASQALMNLNFSAFADYVIASPRKFIGVVDGGILMARKGHVLPTVDLPPVQEGWWKAYSLAARRRAEFDQAKGDRGWFALYQQAEAQMSSAPARMSDVSKHILLSVLDWDDWAERRRKNFGMLAGGLESIAVHTRFSDGTVPLGFPVQVSHRNEMRDRLYSAGIYPPVHWPLDGVVSREFKSSHLLASRIMTLPCDQRYTEADMKRIIDCITL